MLFYDLPASDYLLTVSTAINSAIKTATIKVLDRECLWTFTRFPVCPHVKGSSIISGDLLLVVRIDYRRVPGMYERQKQCVVVCLCGVILMCCYLVYNRESTHLVPICPPGNCEDPFVIPVLRARN